MILKVRKSDSLKGEIKIPASKVHSYRALILASLAEGVSIIKNPKTGSDWDLAVEAMRMYGANIEKIRTNIFKVTGVGAKLKTPPDVINVGNSGTMLFFLAGVAALCSGWSVITGDESIRLLRKISKNLFPPFKQLGIKIISTKNDGMAPLIIKGKVKKKIGYMNGFGCQPVFSVLIAAALSRKKVDIFVENPGETAYIELLLYWFRKVGIKFENVGGNYTHYKFTGNSVPKAFEAIIPLEWSAVSYPLLSAFICQNSEIKIRGMDFDDPYGDRQVIKIFQKMGAKIEINDNCITAKSSKLYAVEVDMNALPDQLPTVAVAACFAKGKTIIKNALTARYKECDRIHAMFIELRKMGAKIKERRDGLEINSDGSWKLKGASVNGYRDHRIVMALAVAGLGCAGETVISDAEYVEKSFDNFIMDMKKAGAKYQLY